MTSLVASRHFASAAEGDNKSLLRFALFLSPIVKISLTLHFATSPEGGSENLASPKTTTLKSMATLKNRTACGSQSAAGGNVESQRRYNRRIVRFNLFI